MSAVAGDFFECDYDRNPTHIYKLIEIRDWEGVQYQASYFPDEVRTFIVRKRNEVDLLRWRILPIHGAILMQAPFETIRALLRSYPEGVKAQDDQGNLPLHLAVKKHYETDTINLLLGAYPEGCDVPNSRGVTPYQTALTSSSPHKEYYQRALKRGSPTHDAVTASLADLLCGVNFPMDMTSCGDIDPTCGVKLPMDSLAKSTGALRKSILSLDPGALAAMMKNKV